MHRERDRSPPRPPGFRNTEHLRTSYGETESATPREDRFIATLVHPHGCFSFLVGVEDLAMRTISTLAVAGLLVLGTFAAAGALSSPFTFLGEAMGGQSRWTEGLATDTLITGSSSGTIVAAIPVGNGPYDLAYDSGNGYVYVANSNLTSCEPGCVRPGNVTVIDGTTVITTIPVGNGPEGVAYDSGNGYVYVTNCGSNNVSVIDGTIVIATVPVGNCPVHAAYDNASRYVYVANSGTGNVSVIDGTTVVGTIPVGGNPSGVAYDGGNGYVYVANSFTDGLSAIDGTTVVGTVPVGQGANPVGVAYHIGNGFVYVADFIVNTVSVISTTAQLFLVTFTEAGLPSGTSWSVTLEGLSNSSATPTITFSQPNGTHSYAVGRVTGSAAYYYPSSSSASVPVNGAPSSVDISFTANTRGGTVVATVPVGNYPVGAAYNSKNGYVYVANFVSNSVSLISGTTVVATVPIGYGANPHGVAYDVVNSYVYVANYGQKDVNVIDGTAVVATVPVGTCPYDLAYDTLDGYVYVANYADFIRGNVSVISETAVVAWIPVGEYPDAVAYDAGNGCAYVARYYAGTVSVICTAAQLSLVSFTEVGLTSGTSWSVAIGGFSDRTTSPTITFSEPDGQVSFVVSRTATSATYYDPSPSSGSVAVNRAPLNVTISFTATTAGGIVVATIPVGGDPSGVAYDSRSRHIYVANGGANNVSVIDGTIVVATIPVGGDPSGVAYVSGNGYVYVADQGANNISVIYGTTVLTTVPVGSGPHGVAYDRANGYVYVANSYSSTVTVINGTTVVATIPVGNSPAGVGYDAGNEYVYVTSHGSDTVTVINGTTVVATVRVGYLSQGVAYDSRNLHVYVANQASNTVSVINRTTVVATVPVGNGPDGVAYDSGNGFMYVANSYSNHVSVISSPKVLTTIPVGSYPAGVAYDSANGYVYVANQGSNTVSVISTFMPPASPSAPRNLIASPGVGRVVLTWQAPVSDGGAPITSYAVRRGISSGGETSLTTVGEVLTYTGPILTNRNPYFYQVSAVNEFGEGSKSAEVAATPMPSLDSYAPSVAISSPSNNTVLSSTTVTLRGTASDNVAVQRVELSTDGTGWNTASGTTTWSGTTTLHLGTNVIYARATDTSGNQATVQITVTVAGYGPTGLDPVILATILVALGAVGVAMTLIAWKRRKTTQSP